MLDEKLEPEMKENDFVVEIEGEEAPSTAEVQADTGEPPKEPEGQTGSDNSEGSVAEPMFKSLEEAEKAYTNIKSLSDRQGNELGEARKIVRDFETSKPATPKTQDEQISAMDIQSLNESIEVLEADLRDPDLDVYDVSVRDKQILHQKLLSARVSKSFEQKYQTKESTAHNQKMVEKFKELFPTMGDEDMDIVVDIAKQRFTDEVGKIDQRSLESALFYKNPEEYKTHIAISSAKSERERMAQAGTSKQPVLSAAGKTGTKTINMDAIARSGDMERLQREYLKLSPEQQIAYKKKRGI